MEEGEITVVKSKKGGKREGSGRKLGSKNKKVSHEILRKALTQIYPIINPETGELCEDTSTLALVVDYIKHHKNGKEFAVHTLLGKPVESVKLEADVKNVNGEQLSLFQDIVEQADLEDEDEKTEQ